MNALGGGDVFYERPDVKSILEEDVELASIES
jgi:hypothetical protein